METKLYLVLYELLCGYCSLILQTYLGNLGTLNSSSENLSDAFFFGFALHFSDVAQERIDRLMKETFLHK